MKFLTNTTQQICTLATLALFSSHTLASVVISGTRVIYPSEAKEVSVNISNVGPSPVLLQSWIDSGDANAKPAAIKVPFVLTPPINRVEAGKGQTLRISSVEGTLPMDKESVFWLNVLEVPAKGQAKTSENKLQMAFRTRIKLFYRPVGLEGNANDAAKSVTWSTLGSQVQATNPTPFYVSLVNLSINGKKLDSAMIAPLSTRVLELPAQAGNKISGSFVNDYGAVLPFDAAVK
ncbi:MULTISPECIES: fimbria/pilus periplasmic chaperone [unclassified Serratia (in: enterobacteria)]|uniref:fimbria/pilus periplasmic chaperone n=1 Tax=unclassified Serratia (in: enterobacteria) TaxID=2647522 RepID=UPI000506238E|nr:MULTISPECIES: fimbria/pilus periplasmic chaperone [unclassified Serratia (in: enterobacteria)]KFK96583.1 pilus assembly protein PapD [Serratia sp. Ag2]KFK99797.1 pilus assembly protein PapD [Serratia sp. Ag1]